MSGHSDKRRPVAMPLLAIAAGGVCLAAVDSLSFLGAGPARRPLSTQLAPSAAGAVGPTAVDGGVHSVRLGVVLAPMACAAVVLLRRPGGLRSKASRALHVRKFFGGGGKEASEEEMSEDSKIRCEKLAAEIQEIKEHCEEKQAAQERLQMEMQNYRTRTKNELAAARGKASIPIFKELMPIADEFDLAQQNLKLESDGERAISEKFAGLFDKMLDLWKTLGVEKMEAVGEDFDPELHEAVSMVPSEDYPADKVSAVLRGGWVMKLGAEEKQVLRPALVCVSAGPGPS